MGGAGGNWWNAVALAKEKRTKMDAHRRGFLKLAGAGLAGAVAGCTSPVPSSAPTQSNANRGDGPPPAGSTTLEVRIVGGLAMVVPKSGQLSVVTASTHGLGDRCHFVEHGMDLKIVTGTLIEDRTTIPSSKEVPTAAAVERTRWVLNGHRGIVGGMTAGKLILPKDSGGMTVGFPKDPKEPFDWNDLQNVYQPLKYHAGAYLNPKWHEPDQPYVHSMITIPSGTLSIRDSRHPCVSRGIWTGSSLKDPSTPKFMKPLSALAVLDGQLLGADLEISFGPEEKLVVGPTGGRIAIELFATARYAESAFVPNRRFEHMGMFYGLILGSDNNFIPCDERITPVYTSYHGAEGYCGGKPYPGAPKYTPGIGCGDAVFVEL
jgi:hypothetical protein